MPAFRLLLLIIALGCTAPALADLMPEKLTDQAQQAVVARFAAAAQGGSQAVWAEIQSCYHGAEGNPAKIFELRDCLLMDQADRMVEEIAVKRAGTGHPPEWAAPDAYSKRAGKYASMLFPDPLDYAKFQSLNNNSFLTAILKAVINSSLLPPPTPARN